MAQLLPYLHILQRGWWIIALAALASFNLALFNSYNTTPTYRARALFLVSPGPSILAGANDDLVRSIEALDKRSIVSTYAEILGSATIYEETVDALQIDKEVLSGYKPTAVVLPDASVLELTIEGSNPDMVALLANQVGERAIHQIKGLYLVYDINFLDPATAPSSPFSPMPLRDSAIALVLGAAAGVLLALLKEILTSPLTFFRQRLIIDRDSTAYTSRYMEQLVEQTLSTADVTTLSFLKIANLPELKEYLPQPIWQELAHHIVTIIRQELRGKDYVSHWDETTFALLLPNITSDSASAMVTVLYNHFLDPINLPSYADPIQLRTRIGITATHNTSTPETLIQAAEHALAQAAAKSPPIAIYNDPPIDSLSSTTSSYSAATAS